MTTATDTKQIQEQKHIGRPTKLTPQLQHDFCALIAKGHPITSACWGVCISTQRYSDWCRRGDEEEEQGIEGPFRAFRDSVKMAQAQVISDRLDQLKKAGKVVNHWAANAWLLERTHPELFAAAPELRVKVSGTIDHTFKGLMDRVATYEIEQGKATPAPTTPALAPGKVEPETATD